MMEPAAQPVNTTTAAPRVGTRDGVGAADHDQPYRFGSRPTSAWTYPFSARQYARLLVLRGRVTDGEFEADRRRV